MRHALIIVGRLSFIATVLVACSENLGSVDPSSNDAPSTRLGGGAACSPARSFQCTGDHS